MSRNSINRNLQKILTPRSTKKLVNWATQINILKSFYIDLFIHYLLSKGSKTIYPKTCRTNETKAGKQEQRNMSSVVRQLELGISWAEKQGNVCSECVGRGVCVCVCVCVRVVGGPWERQSETFCGLRNMYPIFHSGTFQANDQRVPASR